MNNRINELELGIYSGYAAIQLTAMLASPEDRMRQQLYIQKITNYLKAAGIGISTFTAYQLSSVPRFIYVKAKKGLQKLTPETAKRLRGQIETSEVEVSPDGDFTTPARSKRKFDNTISPDDQNKKTKLRGSFPNIPDTTEAESTPISAMAMTDGDSNGKNINKTSETQIDNLNYAIYRPFPNTHQVLMPYHGRFNWSISQNNGVNRFKLRMNSIYDIINASFLSNYAEGNATTSDTQNGTINQPQMRAYWASIYKYYTVVACKYKVRFRLTTDTRTDSAVMIYQYEHTQTDPPLFDGGGTNVLSHDYRQHHPNCRFKQLETHGGFATETSDAIEVISNATGPEPPTKVYNYTGGNTYAEPWQPNTQRNMCEFSGIYHYGDINHEILDDDNLENWTQMGETPKAFENHTYIIQHSPYAQAVVALAGTYWLDLEYIVQLKDLTMGYKYIGNGYNLAAVTAPFAPVNDS